MHGHFNEAQVRGIADAAEGIVDKAFEIADDAATAAFNAISDKFEETFYPGEHRHKKRNAQYKAAMNALFKEAQAAAAAGDYVSAYAIAKGAQNLGAMTPYSTWTQIAGARAQMTATATTYANTYGGKAGTQMQGGKGAFYKPGGIPWGMVATGIAAIALFMSATKKGGNGS